VSPLPMPTDSDLATFVYHEARLIDEKRFDEWYDLFAADGIYWIPLTRGQPDGRAHTSLFYEDRLLLKLRIERLRNPQSFSQARPSFCQHVLQSPSVERRDVAANKYLLRTSYVYIETQLDHQRAYGCIAWHHLQQTSGGFSIGLKKIELLNCDAALPSLELFP
jgi:3-phenylpropionate/cinnamic acid dioxygenase small subunit